MSGWKSASLHRAAPDAGVLRQAMKNANQLLDYADWLLDHRHWLAGATMSLADLAGAAHISVADYLGGIDWRGHERPRPGMPGSNRARASARCSPNGWK